jgi:hypothetical protein
MRPQCVEFTTMEDLWGEDSAVVLRDRESYHGALHFNVITECVWIAGHT